MFGTWPFDHRGGIFLKGSDCPRLDLEVIGRETQKAAQVRYAGARRR